MKTTSYTELKEVAPDIIAKLVSRPIANYEVPFVELVLISPVKISEDNNGHCYTTPAQSLSIGGYTAIKELHSMLDRLLAHWAVEKE